MKKIIRISGDIAATAGCCIGIGFLSGKEAQIFFGNTINVIIFALTYGLSACAIREFCRRKHCDGVAALSEKLLPKRANIINAALALCSFVCVTTTLAGVEECLSTLFSPAKLPVFAFTAAVCAAIICRTNIKIFKATNVISISLAIALLCALTVKSGSVGQSVNVPPYRPAAYALFGIATSLGVTAKLGEQSSAKENIVCSVLSALLLAALIIWTLPLCDFSKALPVVSGMSGPLKIFAAITLLLASVTGLAANALPVTEYLSSVLPDTTVCTIMTFGTSLALSMFGFDFAVKYGYAVIAAVGAALVAVATKKLYGKCWGQGKL